MNRDTEASGNPPPTLRLKAAQIRYSINWQGTAIKMQFERLDANMRVDPEAPVEEVLRSHMRAVVDLDFLVTSVRRLLRVAEQVRSFGLDPEKELKLAIKIFSSRWLPYLVDIRDTLEHVDEPGTPLVPFRGGGIIAFTYPGGQLDAGKLYIATMKLYEAICRVIEPFED